MKPPGKQYRWFAAGLVVFATIMIGTRLVDSEPRFEGRKLSAWLDDPTLPAAELERGVRAMGTNALPQLQVWLVQEPSLLERTIRQLDDQIDFIGIGFHPSLDANFRAMRGFLALGELSAPAVPWLEAGATTRDANFEFYLKALTVCGPAGWQAFDRLQLGASSPENKSFLNALAFGANRSRDSMLRLARYLKHPDLNARREAYQTIRLLREQCPAELLAALATRATEESDDQLRATASLFATELAKDRSANASAPPRK